MSAKAGQLAPERVVWVFSPIESGTRFPTGVWSTKAKAREWIAECGAKGCLSAYVLDESAYESNVRLGLLNASSESRTTPEFKRVFTTAIEHEHYGD
jgi:hypothetical protein